MSQQTAVNWVYGAIQIAVTNIGGRPKPVLMFVLHPHYIENVLEVANED